MNATDIAEASRFLADLNGVRKRLEEIELLRAGTNTRVNNKIEIVTTTDEGWRSIVIDTDKIISADYILDMEARRLRGFEIDRVARLRALGVET